jgi:uncharacterized NAD(P)/FAD-binding protein YdhS
VGCSIIIGGGAGGCLVAAQWLRRAVGPSRLVLIERSDAVGRGFAYGTAEPGHLLNVPAGRMGAFPDEPDHFFRWVAARVGQPGFPAAVGPGDFLPRLLYGRYLGEVLAAARGAAAPGVEFDVIHGEAVDLEERPEGARVHLRDGRIVEGSRVVLALGNLPGEYPIKRPLPFYHGQRYVHIPWENDALAGLSGDEDILLVGAGLTAIDVLVRAEAGGHRGVIHALSRNGLRPLVHQPAAPWPPLFLDEPAPTTVRALLHRVRTEVRAAAARGVDWQPVVDALRPRSQALWAALSWPERARFMRHLRPYWEVHRHRLAPQVAAAVARLEAAGRVRFSAGRLETLREVPGGAEAVFRRRGTGERVTLRVARVINCTGPRSDYSKFQHPLLVNLLARGLIDHDPLALGIQALPSGEVLRYRAGPTGWLFTLGAPLKGVLWESTAMPEIRVQAQVLAERLLLDR